MKDKYVSYPYWVGYGYGLDGTFVSGIWGGTPEASELFRQRAAKNSLSLGDTTLISDMVLANGPDEFAFTWNGHFDGGDKQAGGNVLINAGAVKWRPFYEMEEMLYISVYAARFCF